MSSYLLEVARSRRSGVARGIYSVCSAHPWVLEAAMRRQLPQAGPLLVEATCNQVNQFGGYTGLTPAAFRDRIFSIAQRCGFPVERIVLGGDHLGPFPWQHLPAKQAMKNACDLVGLYVREGYSKIHLDASMPCADDSLPLQEKIIAERAARLCAAAEESAQGGQPVFVIGTEVPTPGGAAEELEMSVTSPGAAEQAVKVHYDAFSAHGLHAAWERIIALVVQPGVEFGNESVEDYEPQRAQPLLGVLQNHDGLVFEAHSTDYQLPAALSALVRDGFSILKVGPALTYAMRRALFALAAIETKCVPDLKQSRLEEKLESVMLKNPAPWQKHYSGSPEEQRRLRMHSYSDRIRYYWTEPAVVAAVETLIANIDASGVPETLLSDYLPAQYEKVRAGALPNEPLPLVLDVVGDALDPYIAACA